jgi:hypothetical protein
LINRCIGLELKPAVRLVIKGIETKRYEFKIIPKSF